MYRNSIYISRKTKFLSDDHWNASWQALSKVHGIGHKPLAFVVLIFTHKTVYSANLRWSDKEFRATDHPTGIAGPFWELICAKQY
jgi:hypothetical protein